MMMHHMAGRKLGMKTAHRQAMMANMAASLILHDRIETTLPRAKTLKPLADRAVTLSKRGTLAARRKLLALIRDPNAVRQAFATFKERFATRQGGYTRVYQLGYRHGDSAPMAAIEYLRETRADTPASSKKKKEKKTVVNDEKQVGAKPKPRGFFRKARSE